MKKLLIASLIAITCNSVFAAEKGNADVIFSKANQLYEAKNYTAAFQEIQRIAASGNAQAIYNLGSMTQQGLGTAKDEKRHLNTFKMPQIKDLVRRVMNSHKYIDMVKAILESRKTHRSIKYI